MPLAREPDLRGPDILEAPDAPTAEDWVHSYRNPTNRCLLPLSRNTRRCGGWPKFALFLRPLARAPWTTHGRTKAPNSRPIHPLLYAVPAPSFRDGNQYYRLQRPTPRNLQSEPLPYRRLQALRNCVPTPARYSEVCGGYGRILIQGRNPPLGLRESGCRGIAADRCQ